MDEFWVQISMCEDNIYTTRQAKLGQVSKSECKGILLEAHLSLCAHNGRTKGYTMKTIGVYIAKLIRTVQ